MRFRTRMQELELVRFDAHKVDQLPPVLEVRKQPAEKPGEDTWEAIRPWEVWDPMTSSWQPVDDGDFIDITDPRDIYVLTPREVHRDFIPVVGIDRSDLRLRSGRWRRWVPGINNTPPPILAASARREAFYDRMHQEGVDREEVKKVMHGFMDIGEDVYGETSWWKPGRAALGLVVDLVRALL